MQVVEQQATGHTEDTWRDGKEGRSLIDKKAYIAHTGLHSRVRDINDKVEDTGLRRTNLERSNVDILSSPSCTDSIVHCIFHNVQVHKHAYSQ